MKLAEAWNRFWFAPAPLVRLALFRILSGWLLLYDAFLYDPRGAVWTGEHTVESTWRPVYAFELLGLDAPSAGVAQAIHVLQIVAIVCATLGFRTRTAWIAATILGFWSGGVVYSFTKVRHDRVALFFASLALGCAPSGARLSVDAMLAHRRGRRPPDETAERREESAWAMWPIRLTQVTIAIGYCAAGLSKLSAPGWTNGYTLQGILLSHDGRWAGLVASDVWICRIVSVATLVVEAGFPAVLVWPRLAVFFVPAALAFHVGTWATMDTGPYMTLWYFLIAFLPFDDFFLGGRGAREKRTWRTRSAAVVIGIWLALAAVVMAQRIPPALCGAMLAATAAVVWASSRSKPGTGGAPR
jgi:hypothetical protein